MNKKTTDSPKHTNRLIHESSPYLLQHAHNPVDWYPWGEEALQKAKKEDKPILISIGYAACHWCHVMERESFENEDVAAYMNAHFVNIKLDREERPDLDQIYMDAVTAISGAGGWPLNCFLMPDGRPFYGGTYYPPKPNYGRPHWLGVLQWIQQLFMEERAKVETQANQLFYHIANSDKNIFASKVIELDHTQAFEKEQFTNIYKILRTRFDTLDGGFGDAPKFPQTMNLHLLLSYAQLAQKDQPTYAQEALSHALFSLNKMIDGGIYDHLGGGFSRYTVDKIWLVPHFEKMLYDNALLINVLSEAYQITQNERYREVIDHTLAFVEREMMAKEGGFYAAYDADSEGVEGKFYVWQKAEIEAILGQKEAAIFNDFYDVTEDGNWEYQNILNKKYTYKDFAKKYDYQVLELKNKLKEWRQQLFKARSKRIPPALDDKIILSWNAMMVTAFAKAYQATGQANFKTIAVKNLQFLCTKFRENEKDNKNLTFHHTYKNGRAYYPAFLDDYALLIEALLTVYEINFDSQLLDFADNLTQHTIANFGDPNDNLFFYTAKNQKDIIIRKKEYYDGATPSGNSTMAHNLLRLGALLDKENYTKQATYVLKSIENMLEKYPTSVARWTSTALNLAYPSYEIVVIGEAFETMTAAINKLFVPNKVLMASQKSNKKYTLLDGKIDSEETLIYVCQNHTCQQPVTTINAFKSVIEGTV